MSYLGVSVAHAIVQPRCVQRVVARIYCEMNNAQSLLLDRDTVSTAASPKSTSFHHTTEATHMRLPQSTERNAGNGCEADLGEQRQTTRV